MLVVILNVVLWPLLHYTGIQDFYYLIDPANGVLIFLAVSGIVILIVDAIKGHTASYHYTFIGFFGFLVGCLVELTNGGTHRKGVRKMCHELRGAVKLSA